jgi:hypothetical protein
LRLIQILDLDFVVALGIRNRPAPRVKVAALEAPY